MPTPSNMIRSTLAAAFIGTALAAGSGCTTRTATFDGVASERVWPAMVATARTPAYGDWKVLDNQVHADDATRTIEVYRTIKRTRITPDSEPREEARTWKFQIELSPSGDGSVIRFSARQFAVPSHVWNEADRFFAQMRQTLDAPAPAAEVRATEAQGREAGTSGAGTR